MISKTRFAISKERFAISKDRFHFLRFRFEISILAVRCSDFCFQISERLSGRSGNCFAKTDFGFVNSRPPIGRNYRENDASS